MKRHAATKAPDITAASRRQDQCCHASGPAAKLPVHKTHAHGWGSPARAYLGAVANLAEAKADSARLPARAAKWAPLLLSAFNCYCNARKAEHRVPKQTILSADCSHFGGQLLSLGCFSGRFAGRSVGEPQSLDKAAPLSLSPSAGIKRQEASGEQRAPSPSSGNLSAGN